MNMTTMIAPQTVLPPDDPDDLTPVSNVLPELPPQIRQGLAAFIGALSSGEAVRVEPISTMLTTSQAADILNVSRMTLIKLLDQGRIAYEQPNVHRFVRLADVLAYKDERSKKRSAYFQDSMKDAEIAGLLQTNIEEYESALENARSRRHP